MKLGFEIGILDKDLLCWLKPKRQGVSADKIEIAHKKSGFIITVKNFLCCINEAASNADHQLLNSTRDRIIKRYKIVFYPFYYFPFNTNLPLHHNSIKQYFHPFNARIIVDGYHKGYILNHTQPVPNLFSKNEGYCLLSHQ